MLFQLSWTGFSGAQSEIVSTASAAWQRYRELEGNGYPNVRVTDGGGKAVSADDLALLEMMEKTDA